MQYAPPPTRRSRRGLFVGLAVVVVIAVIVAAVVVARRYSSGPDSHSDGHSSTASSSSSLAAPPKWGKQTTVPLPGLTKPDALAITPDGGVYVACCKGRGGAQLWIDEPGASFPTHQVVPLLTGGIAVDRDGNVYYADPTKIAKLTAGGTTAETRLPFPDPDFPIGIAVDGAGAVYVLHRKLVDLERVKTSPELWKLEPGAQAATVTPLDGAVSPDAIAVDQSGTVYIADGAERRVLKYAAGATDPAELAVPEGFPSGLAVDDSGAVYVASAPVVTNGILFRFAPGSNEAEKLPLTGVRWRPSSSVGLGADHDGNVYVTDRDQDRVLKVPRLTP